MDQPTETPKKSPGAPKDNTNALKHGFYALRTPEGEPLTFRKAEETDLSTLDFSSLEHEIQLLRVFIRRTAEQNKETTPEQSLVLLSVLSKAALSVGSLIRTQRAALLVQQHDELELIFAQARAEFQRARELINRTNAALRAPAEGHLADLEAAQAGDEEEEEDEEDDEEEPTPPQEEIKYSLDADSETSPPGARGGCDVPTDCVPCPDHLTCPDCPGELKEFLKKHPAAAALIDPNCSANSIRASGSPRFGLPQERRGDARPRGGPP